MNDANAGKGRPVTLDWSRLLGFDQAGPAPAGDALARRARLAKVGTKIGGKPGLTERS